MRSGRLEGRSMRGCPEKGKRRKRNRWDEWKLRCCLGPRGGQWVSDSRVVKEKGGENKDHTRSLGSLYCFRGL